MAYVEWVLRGSNGEQSGDMIFVCTQTSAPRLWHSLRCLKERAPAMPYGSPGPGAHSTHRCLSVRCIVSSGSKQARSVGLPWSADHASRANVRGSKCRRSTEVVRAVYWKLPRGCESIGHCLIRKVCAIYRFMYMGHPQEERSALTLQRAPACWNPLSVRRDRWGWW